MKHKIDIQRNETTVGELVGGDLGQRVATGKFLLNLKNQIKKEIKEEMGKELEDNLGSNQQLVQENLQLRKQIAEGNLKGGQ